MGHNHPEPDSRAQVLARRGRSSRWAVGQSRCDLGQREGCGTRHAACGRRSRLRRGGQAPARHPDGGQVGRLRTSFCAVSISTFGIGPSSSIWSLPVTERLDVVARSAASRTDFGELAARALATTLTRTIGDALPGLLEATPEDVQAAARRYSWSRGISELSRKFFGTLVAQTLSYWLDRTARHPCRRGTALQGCRRAKCLRR